MPLLYGQDGGRGNTRMSYGLLSWVGSVVVAQKVNEVTPG
jgi:hypothetical protein